ncbi:MAG: putative ribosomal protein YlxQ [Syntrophomonadaceae bacterium]|nr:putative ribosomal protein YlxQ [Bacillota bacterium]
MSSKLLLHLGLARKAGKLSCREADNVAAIRSGRARLLLLACDAGQSTVKKYRNKCRTFAVPVLYFATAAELGWAIGLSPRPALVLLDEGLASRLKELAQEEGVYHLAT